jgi:hypothetical protein
LRRDRLRVAVRGRKDRGGPALLYTPRERNASSLAKDGEFDLR